MDRFYVPNWSASRKADATVVWNVTRSTKLAVQTARCSMMLCSAIYSALTLRAADICLRAGVEACATQGQCSSERNIPETRISSKHPFPDLDTPVPSCRGACIK